MRGGPRESAADTAATRYKGADGRWHARVTVGRRLDGERDRRHLTRKTRRELDTAIRELENARDSGQQPWLLENTTVQAWVEHWLDEILPLAVRGKTRSGYSSHMRVHVIPFIRSARMTDLRPETLERLYRELLAQGRSTYVVHGVHRTLRSCLSEAVRRQRILTNPAALAPPPRVERTEIEPLTVEECRAVLTAARGRYNGARWSVALSLGLRQGEALGLLWSDIDLDAGILRVKRALQRRTWMHGCSPRSRKVPVCGSTRGTDCPERREGGLVLAEPTTRASRRSVALPPPLVAELRAHRAAQLRVKLERANVWDHTLDLVFSTDWGIPIDPAADQRAWKQLLRDAGVREARLHDARHTAATLCYSRVSTSAPSWRSWAGPRWHRPALRPRRRRTPP